jgi:hypothetical protein
MRVVFGSVVSAMLSLAVLLLAVGQAGLIARYADAAPANKVASDSASTFKGGPVVYGWLSVQPASSRHD